MKCGMFTNADGQVLLVHDKPVSSDIQWVEYNTDEKKFTLIHEDGSTQDLGIDLNEKSCANLLSGMEVRLAYISNHKIQDVQTVSIVIQDY